MRRICQSAGFLETTSCQRRKTCEMELAMLEGENISPNDSVFELVEWSKLTSLTCCHQFFQELTCTLEALQILDIKACYDEECSCHDGKDDCIIYLRNAMNLKQLTLSCVGDYRMSQMNKLRKISSLKGATISGTSPLCELLPNLTTIEAYDEWQYGGILPPITRSGVFTNVEKLTLREFWEDFDEQIGEGGAELMDSFPSLSNLCWESQSENNCNCLLAAPVIFSSLEFLTKLKLGFSDADEEDVFQLITGIQMNEIPENEDTWLKTLKENQSICTIKCKGN